MGGGGREVSSTERGNGAGRELDPVLSWVHEGEFTGPQRTPDRRTLAERGAWSSLSASPPIRRPSGVGRPCLPWGSLCPLAAWEESWGHIHLPSLPSDPAVSRDG